MELVDVLDQFYDHVAGREGETARHHQGDAEHWTEERCYPREYSGWLSETESKMIKLGDIFLEEPCACVSIILPFPSVILLDLSLVFIRFEKSDRLKRCSDIRNVKGLSLAIFFGHYPDRSLS